MSFGRTGFVVLALTLVLASMGSANLLLNPSFEDPLGAEWTFTVDTPGTATWTSAISTTAFHDGASSLYLKYGPVGDISKAHMSQTISGLTPGQTYNISGWVDLVWRATKGWAYIQAVGGGATVQAPAKGANVDATWTQYALSQTADAGGTLTINLVIDKYATTTVDKTVSVYFDELVVEAVPEPSTMLALVAGLPLLGFAIRRKR